MKNHALINALEKIQLGATHILQGKIDPENINIIMQQFIEIASEAIAQEKGGS